jgi:hypothetical protein
MTARPFYFYINICLVLAFISCAPKKENNNSTMPTTTTPKSQTSGKPDPSLEVKDDFTLLTKADEEREDKSHMDMSYFPSNYALDKALNKNIDLKLRITYSRPHKGTRTKIFGADSSLLVPYGKLWRLGANESTEIEFIKPATIEGKKINPGRYSVYAIPEKDYWSIVINQEIYTFGSFNYNPAKDILKAKATVSNSKFSLETFLIYFQKSNTGCNMILSWDDVIATLPITLN